MKFTIFTPGVAIPLFGAKIYASDTGVKVIVNQEPTRHGRLWHLSISRNDRYPSWDEIREARDSLLPKDMDFMMILPQEKDYVNVHPNCFHLWQAPKEWGVQ
jgi:hypothetical protein